MLEERICCVVLSLTWKAPPDLTKTADMICPAFAPKFRKSKKLKVGIRADLMEELQALRATRLEIDLLLNESSDPIFSLSANGTYRYANQALAESLGLSVEEIVGKTQWDLFAKEDADRRFADISWVFKNAQVKVVEVRCPAPNGDRHHLTTIKPILNERGLVACVICIAKDISERKQLEQTLQDGEQDFRELFMQSPIPMTLNNMSGVIEAVNNRFVEVFGYTREDIPNIDAWWEKAYPDATYRAEIHAAWDRVRENGLPDKSLILPLEVRFTRKDGNQRTVLISGVFIRDHRLITLDDITERRLLEADLQSDKIRAETASRSKSRFLAAASHDLRQPAHALGMFAARLAELPNDPQARHLIGRMEESVRAMQDMLDGFFDISRLDDESMPPKLVACPVATVFEQLRNNFIRAAIEKGLRLRFRRTGAWVQSDPALLQRILLNLVSNAIRYTHQGNILVACRPTSEGKHVRIEVWDSGEGIAPQHHDEIFSEFFQVGNPQRDRTKGLGVGLSIVDRACRLLNHPLSMRSSLGHGTRFSLLVPLAPTTSLDRPEASTVRLGWGSLKGLRILLIEDDVLGMEGISSLLSSWGCQVTQAEGAIRARELYQRDASFNLIISDFRLGGGINGIETIRMLHQIAGQPIAACLITGDPDVSVKNQALEAGLFFMQKPLRPAKLRSLLRNLLKVTAPSEVTVGAREPNLPTAIQKDADETRSTVNG